MGVSVKLGAGAALVAIGLSGLAYAIPLISDETSEEQARKEADDSAHSRSLAPYVAMEIISAAVLTGGIALCAVAQGEALAGPGLPVHADARGRAGIDDAKETEAA